MATTPRDLPLLNNVQPIDAPAKLLRLERQNAAMRRLVEAVQELSLARTLENVIDVVRRAARELTGADGAAFVLRDGDKCFYAEENAIAPLWKGQRFPLSACISGWAMLNRQPAVIEDIYSDPRVPVDAYRPTFVKSLVMVPVRTENPIAAIGNYWAKRHRATQEEMDFLQALANTTAVALEDVQVYGELEKRVRERTSQLQQANEELESFSSSVSHDLRAPLQQMLGYSEMLREYAPQLDEKARGYLANIGSAAQQMGQLINDLLRLGKCSRAELFYENVNLSEIAHRIAVRLKASDPQNTAEFKIHDCVEASGDRGLLTVVLENLLSNAWKYSAKKSNARIEFGCVIEDAEKVYFVRDAGAGFDPTKSARLFEPFQRLHSDQEFSGTGVGLATVRRIIHRHGGLIWAHAAVDKGATFFFTVPERESISAS